MAYRIEVGETFKNNVKSYMNTLMLKHHNTTFAKRLDKTIQSEMSEIGENPKNCTRYIFYEEHEYEYYRKLFGKGKSKYTIFYTVDKNDLITFRYFFYKGFSEGLLAHKNIDNNLIIL